MSTLIPQKTLLIICTDKPKTLLKKTNGDALTVVKQIRIIFTPAVADTPKVHKTIAILQ